jgi:asparagine synthase (glutamine-hydrolysing)
MSGIAGLLYFDNRPVDPQQVQMMAGTLAHRGPDGINSLQLNGLALVNCLLRTTPESLYENQPLQDEDSKIVITADARIDNRQELLDKLRPFKEKSEQTPDSRIILEAYKKWGEECPVQLIGDFAFVIWDPRLRQLFCARDHIGARPFFYHFSNKIFVFASEIKAIFTLPDILNTINESRVADYLQLLTSNNTDTFYKNIFRLAPASSLLLSNGKCVISKYWDYNHAHTIKRADNDAYAIEFKDILFEAVRCRLKTVSPIGCTMSGGLDSSSVACVANRILDNNKRLHTFSYNFPLLADEQLKKIDERHYQAAVLATGDFIHHDIIGSEYAPLRDIAIHIKTYDQPFFYPHLYLEWQAWSIAQGNEIRVMLNGMDGDSVISHGYEYLQDLILHGRFMRFLKNIREVSERQKLSKKQLVNAYFVRPYLRAPFANIYRLLKRKLQPCCNVSSIISKDFALSSGLTDRIKVDFSPFRTAKRYHYQRLINPLLTDALEETNIFASRFHVEIRTPFFDRRLMEFCYGLPPDQKLQNGWTRFVLRQAMKDVIPAEIFERVAKSNLSPGFIHTLLSNHVNLIENVIKSPSPKLSGKIDAGVLLDQLATFCQNPFFCNRLYHLNLYGIVAMNMWYEQLCRKAE